MLSREDLHEAAWTWFGAMIVGTCIIILVNL